MSSVSDPHDSYTQENRDANEKWTKPNEHETCSHTSGKHVDMDEHHVLKNARREKNRQTPTVRPLRSGDMDESEKIPSEEKAGKQAACDEATPPQKPRAKSSMSPSPAHQRSPPAHSPDRSRSRSVSRSPAARSPAARGESKSEAEHSRSKSPSPSKRRGSFSASRSRSRTPVRRRARSYSRSRSRTLDRRARRAPSGPRRASPVRRRRSLSRSRSRERDYRRDRSMDRGRDRGGRLKGARPDVSQFRKPEKWLLLLFEDALRETLATTRLPCNVSKINDCMRRLDPTYQLDETEFPSFSVMCHWFDDVGGLLEVAKKRDSVMLLGSRLEREVVKRLRSPPPRGPRGGRGGRNNRRNWRGKSPPGRRRRGSRSPVRNGVRDGGDWDGRRGGGSRSYSPNNGRGRGRRGDDDDDRWEMA